MTNFVNNKVIKLFILLLTNSKYEFTQIIYYILLLYLNLLLIIYLLINIYKLNLFLFRFI